MNKKFYLVVSRKEDGSWTTFKRAACNPKPGDGFHSRLAALEALNLKANADDNQYRYRIVEVLEPVLRVILVKKEEAVWR